MLTPHLITAWLNSIWPQMYKRWPALYLGKCSCINSLFTRPLTPCQLASALDNICSTEKLDNNTTYQF